MFQRCKSLCFETLKLQAFTVQLRYKNVMSRAEAKKRRNLLFENEKNKQKAAVGRIEKVEVKYQTPVDEVTLVMNKNLSTPDDCAKHISEGVAKMSALGLVDGLPWDMHRPLVSDCTLKLLNLQNPEDIVVNTAFWRTCSFLLGAMVDSAFKSDIKVYLHSFPVPNIKSGSFVYDVYLDLPEWKPSTTEMRAMSAQFIKLTNQELPVERLETTEDVVLDMFQENPFKTQQIPNIAKGNDNKITLYRVGDHIDISKGPMVGNTSLIGRCTITAVHKLVDAEGIYRFQGVALPKGILLNQFAYGLLEKRARKLNDVAWVPQLIVDNMDVPSRMSIIN
ncbi:mitochondrial ribosomal protein L39 [Calliopsis andreniformis]|uniref:mitochondrial ribosomal protein L39 n=1 Tax=Calliopsis andreniformis TaxID=337506 RepID=UPI003FCCBA75